MEKFKKVDIYDWDLTAPFIFEKTKDYFSLLCNDLIDDTVDLYITHKVKVQMVEGIKKDLVAIASRTHSLFKNKKSLKYLLKNAWRIKK
jgi:hypothetical protein